MVRSCYFAREKDREDVLREACVLTSLQEGPAQ